MAINYAAWHHHKAGYLAYISLEYQYVALGMYGGVGVHLSGRHGYPRVVNTERCLNLNVL